MKEKSLYLYRAEQGNVNTYVVAEDDKGAQAAAAEKLPILAVIGCGVECINEVDGFNIIPKSILD